MKKKGNKSLYIEERDLALVSNFHRLLREYRVLDLDEIFAEIALDTPAPRYYISEDRAYAALLYKRRTGHFDVRDGRRRALLEDLEADVLEILKRGDADRLLDAVYIAVNNPAPSFYLTPGSVRTLIYAALAK